VHFAALAAIADVSLTVASSRRIRPHQSPNGAGKTTMVNCSPVPGADRGRVLWRARKTTGWKPESLSQEGIEATSGRPRLSVR